MKSISIKVGGHSFQIRSDADEAHLRALADDVNERFASIEKRGPRASQEFRAMAMVAILMADELFEARQQGKEIREKARAFAAGLIERIDELLSREAP
jgi:cell division protein ZapA (FtsZ GTPase activity inhibitor)